MGRPRRRGNRLLFPLRPLLVSLSPSAISSSQSTALSNLQSNKPRHSCITARRRRKAGRQPFYGTGWAARPGQQGNAQPYYNNNTYSHTNAQPAPPYSANPAPNNGGGGANQGYYGQQNGVELQSPQPAYGGYAPPPGPPPAKGDGIVR